MIRVLCCCLFALPVYADFAVPEAEIDALFEEWNAEHTPGASVAIGHAGDVLFSKGYGMADLEQSAPITPETIFHVASVSKQFTSFAIMLLEAEGKLSLEDEIQIHLPEIADFGVPVRIRHLIHHTSGVRDQWELLIMAGWRMDDVITMEDVWELMLLQRELNFTPGEQYMYSNMGYTLLAFIVERVSGMSFPDFCKARIFDPLDMTHTHFHVDHQHIVPKRSYSYAKSGDGYRKAVLSFANAGATSLFTTPEDLLKWLDNYRTAKVGGPAVIEKMTTPGLFNSGMSTGYGGGVGLGKYKGIDSISHGGADAGFRSQVMVFPEHQLAIAVTSNLGSFSAAGQAQKIADMLLKDFIVDRREEDDSPEIGRDIISAVRGVYVNPQTGATQSFASRGSRLRLSNGSGPPFALAPKGDLAFVTAKHPEHMHIQFYRGESGEASKVDIAMPGSPLATYIRTQPRPTNPFYPLQFLGTYYSPELDTHWHIVLKDGELALKRRKYGVNDLQSTFTDGYVTGISRLFFTRDNDGHVNGMRLSGPRITGLRFNRVQP